MDGFGKVEPNEVRDRSPVPLPCDSEMRDASVARLRRRHMLPDQRGGHMGAHLVDEDRAEDRQTQARGEVADRLSDAGRLAVRQP